MKRCLVAYKTQHDDCYNLFWEPKGEHSPAQCTPVQMNVSREECEDYRMIDLASRKQPIIYR